MKKRLFAVFFSLTVLACLISLIPSAQATPSNEQAGVLRAGYSLIRIDPSVKGITGLPMSGYGKTITRLSVGTMDDTGDGVINEKDGLFAACVAMTDQYDNTILYFGIDIINTTSSWSGVAANKIVEVLSAAGYQIDSSNIIFNASHTHSGPDLTYGASFTEEELAADATAQTVKIYREWVCEQLSVAALNAMNDREEVTMQKSVVDVSDALRVVDPGKSNSNYIMNYVRHYKNKTGIISGDNFGGTTDPGTTTSMISEPVDMMYLVQFTPKSGNKQPIVLVNWNAHATLNSTSTTQVGKDNHYKISSDYINSLRCGLANKGYRSAFIQGAAGNIEPKTYVTHLKNPSVTPSGGPVAYLYGARLAQAAIYGLENKISDELDTSYIRHLSKNFKFNTNPPTDEEAALITAMAEYTGDTYGFDDLLSYLTYSSANWNKRSNFYDEFPYLKQINSRYQLSNAKGRMYWVDYPQSSINVGAISIGTELSFVIAPCELFDRYSLTATINNTTDNDWNDLIDPNYGMPLIMGYTGNGTGYMPNNLSYTYNVGSTNFASGSYESQATRFGQGTGEALIVFYNELLDEINVTESRIQCECGGVLTNNSHGHTCKDKEFLPWTRTDALPTSGNYYLTEDVIITYQHTVSRSLRLDLNGHNITHLVSAEEGQKAVEKLTHNTRVYSTSGNAYIAVTDSTANAGTVTRDLSDLTDVQKNAIDNYGLIFLVNEGSNASITVYNGIFDVSGQKAGGGGCVALLEPNSSFVIYGGTLRGGISNYGGIMYNRGNAKFYGGLVTGGKTSTNSGFCAGIAVMTHNDIPGKLTFGGDVRIEGNTTANGKPLNIRYSTPSTMADCFIITGDFTGKASVYIPTRSNGLDVGNSENASFTTDNLSLDQHTDYKFYVSQTDVIIGTARNQCECGGTLTDGSNGHVCEKIDFLPWTKTDSLPTSGNYYLLNDITLTAQTSLYNTLRLDLNSHTITHKVAAKQGILAQNGTSHNTRVIYMMANSNLSITDSSNVPGKITRDLSNLSDTQKAAITNWGLIVAMDAASTGTFSLYNGTLDATGMISGGGACVANMGTSANRGSFKMYGGTLKGGKSGRGSCIYSSAYVELYGGSVTGGTTTGTSGAVEITSSGNLLLSGNANVTGNYKADGTTPANITVPANSFTVKGTYSGTAGLFANLADGAVVGIDDNANITGRITGDLSATQTLIYASGDNLMVAGVKTYCECGKTLSGKTVEGHTCSDIQWLPWTSATSLPSSGNYYLLNDVTITSQKSVGDSLKLDLRGHSIAHKVANGSTNTRVFSLFAGGSLVITDSSENPGRVYRDLSLMTEDQRNAVGNYGLLVLLNSGEGVGNFTLYNGIMDASNTLGGGGAIANINKSGSKIIIYGGTIYGTTSRNYNNDGGSAGCIYSQGPVEVHGGTITGGKAQFSGGGIYLTTATGSLLLTGSPDISGNYKLDGVTENNIQYNSNVPLSNIVIKGTFSGTASFSVSEPTNGQAIAKSDNAIITAATLRVDNYPDHSVSLSGSDIVVITAYTVSIIDGKNVSYFSTLENAISAVSTEGVVVKLHNDINETLAINKSVNIDLAGYNLGSNVTFTVPVKFMDSETDDYTIANGNGYGLVTGNVANVEAMDGYMMITESDGTSFHRLNLDTVGVSLRPDSIGIYYQSQFGGDEVIKRNIVAYGTALGADMMPTFADKTYTRFADMSTWSVGMNSAGNSNNLKNGTILEGILNEKYTYSVNRRNAALKVYSQAYVELPDGTRILGKHVAFSLRNTLEGTTGLKGVDQYWSNWSNSQKNKIMNLYETYQRTMENWNLPNIKHAVADRQNTANN